MEEKKVGRAVNLYDKDTGFVYIVNLYIINYIYYHMKKHDAFIENKETSFIYPDQDLAESPKLGLGVLN